MFQRKLWGKKWLNFLLKESKMAMYPCDPKCWPFYIYVALLVLSLASTAAGPGYIDQDKDGVIVRTKINKTQVILSTAVWGALWSWLLYYLCGKCHTGWAWTVLLLPFIVIIGLLVLLGISAVVVGKTAEEPMADESIGGGEIDRQCAHQAEHACGPNDMSSGPGTCYSKAYAACMAMKKA